jgi:hypothetical protein
MVSWISFRPLVEAWIGVTASFKSLDIRVAGHGSDESPHKGASLKDLGHDCQGVVVYMVTNKLDGLWRLNDSKLQVAPEL